EPWSFRFSQANSPGKTEIAWGAVLSAQPSASNAWLSDHRRDVRWPAHLAHVPPARLRTETYDDRTRTAGPQGRRRRRRSLLGSLAWTWRPPPGCRSTTR